MSVLVERTVNEGQRFTPFVVQCTRKQFILCSSPHDVDGYLSENLPIVRQFTITECFDKLFLCLDEIFRRPL